MIGCIAAFVCNCILGCTWYNPHLPTGRLWMRRYFPGKDKEDVTKMTTAPLAFSAIAGATTILLLRFLLIDSLHSTSLFDGIKFGAGLSCLTTLLEFPRVLLSNSYWDVFLLGQLYNFLVMVIAGLCISCFG